MNSELEMVREFMVKHNHDIGVALPEHVNVELNRIADRLYAFAEQLEARIATSCDPRTIRAQLLCEELAETFDAMAIGDETLLLDGLTDLLYVTLGTSVSFDLPIVPAFYEVHRSNMTKQCDDVRVRHKGKEYKQPDLRSILDAHRMDAQQLNERDSIIRDLLLLVDRDVPLGVIKGWHWSTGEIVTAWATAAHLAASDNDINVPPEPLCLQGFKK